MTAHEDIAGVRLFCGDCRDVFDSVGKVDLVVTDPPYRLESGGNTTGEMGGKFARGRYDNSGEIVPCDISFDEFMPAMARCLDQGHAYIMVNNRHVGDALNAAARAGFRFHNLLVWDKVTATPNRWYMKNCEFVLFLFRGAARPIADCGAKQLIRCPNVIGGVHETEKPVELMRYFIRNSSAPGDVVLDPFMGSGSTGVAALLEGRRFIGVERDARYFAIARRRIARAREEQGGELCLAQSVGSVG